MRIIPTIFVVFFWLNSITAFPQLVDNLSNRSDFEKLNLESAIDFLTSAKTPNYALLLTRYQAIVKLQAKESRGAVNQLRDICQIDISSNYWLSVAYAEMQIPDSSVWFLNRYIHQQAIETATDLRNIKVFDPIRNTSAWMDYWDTVSLPTLHRLLDETAYYLRKNQPAEAVKFLAQHQVGELKSDWFYFIALYSFNAGSMADALFYIDKARELYLRDEYLLLQANVLLQINKPVAAIELLEQLVQQNPLLPDIYMLKAKGYLALNQASDAIQSMQTYHSLFCTNQESTKLLIVCYSQNGNFKEALKLLGGYLAMYPADAEAQKEQGKILYRLGNYPQAMYDLSMSLDINPEDGETYYFYGLANKAMGNNEMACYAWHMAAFYGYDKAITELIKCPETK